MTKDCVVQVDVDLRGKVVASAHKSEEECVIFQSTAKASVLVQKNNKKEQGLEHSRPEQNGTRRRPWRVPRVRLEDQCDDDVGRNHAIFLITNAVKVKLHSRSHSRSHLEEVGVVCEATRRGYWNSKLRQNSGSPRGKAICG